MKIGIIHPYFDVIGGAEKTTISLLDALKDTSHAVTLYTTTKNVKIPSKIKICLVNRISFPIGWSLQRIIEMKKLFNKAKNEDLIFVSSGNLILAENKKNIIIYCHSTFESELKKLKIKKSGITIIYHNYIKKQLENQLKLLEKSNIHLIANSNFTKSKIQSLFKKESKVIFPPVKILKKNIKKSKKSGIMTIARYSHEKNLEFNLKVIKNFNVSYKIFGNTKFLSQTNYFKHLKNIIKEKKQIELFHNPNRDVIEESLNLAKIYFQSSEETFGISVIESIMAGCIPIVPDNSANKETVPIDNLRYEENDENDARKKIEAALRGNFDKYLPELQEHVKKFSEETFQKNIIEHLSNFEKNNNENIN